MVGCTGPGRMLHRDALSGLPLGATLLLGPCVWATSLCCTVEWVNSSTVVIPMQQKPSL